MSHLGKTHLVVVLTVESANVAEGDSLFQSHGQWMKGHPKEGPAALLEYSVSKGPELANPLDPGSSPTGKTIYVLDEFYESPEGIARHWQDAMTNWTDMQAFITWAGKASVVTLHNGEAIQALW